ncbi:MAG: hypothetical protein AseanaTS_25060 [Candidatus Pelagadaptatus aseana]|uniref:DUF3081 family protein n=1 Tax=Candidatus Pelagadaptatus aseana TaxID=3120508 RepID=UPI0039B2BCA6
MDEHLQARVLMLAAETIREKGLSRDGRYIFDQVSLLISHDGYTISLSDSQVTLHLYFHNKIAVECKHQRDVETFYRKLKRIGASEVGD